MGVTVLDIYHDIYEAVGDEDCCVGDEDWTGFQAEPQVTADILPKYNLSHA